MEWRVNLLPVDYSWAMAADNENKNRTLDVLPGK